MTVGKSNISIRLKLKKQDLLKNEEGKEQDLKVLKSEDNLIDICEVKGIVFVSISKLSLKNV